MAYVKTLPDEEKIIKYRTIFEVLYNASYPSALTEPYEIKEHDWIDDVTLWPPVDLRDIYLYFVDTPGEFTRERLMGLQESGRF